MSVVITSGSAVGLQLYHSVWSDVGKTFFEVDRLRDWASWEHRFDAQITDLASARDCIDVMLASLNDSYTRRLSNEEIIERKQSRQAKDEAVLSRRFQERIGYLRILGFDADSIVDQVETELRKIADCDAFIIDLTGNGGGLIDETVNCCELVVLEGPIATIERRRGDGIARREVGFAQEAFVLLSKTPDGKEEVDGFRRRRCLIAGKPLVVLMDGGTASSAELFASAVLFNGREDGAVHSIGNRTHGKGIGQQTLSYDDGTKVKVTFARFYGADDSWFGDAGQTVANGIVPDEEVDGWKNQMDAALTWLRTRLGIS